MASFFRAFFRSTAVIVLCTIAVPATVLAVCLGSFIFLPLPVRLPDPKPLEAGQISYVYDQNGEEIGQFREFEQAIPVSESDIPLHLKQAVVAAEDRNFYSHGGVDVRGSTRALVADLRGQSVTQGGSTITQQYVKQTYVGKERTIYRKVREAIVASQLDRKYEKDDILFRYLSTIYLGEGAYGVGAASETYFRKPVSQLSISEAATLAGVIPAPSRYEPRGNPELAETKRKIVLGAMLRQRYITQEQHDAAVLEVIVNIGPNQAPLQVPHTAIYPPKDTITRYPYFMDYVEKYLKGKYGAEKVDRGGLRIQTTLDPRIQAAAEKVQAEAIKGVRPATVTKGPLKGQPTPFEMAIAAVEPPTGFVKALVGGRDFYAGGASQVNLALGGCYKPPAGPDLDSVEVEAACWGPDSEGKFPKSGGSGRQPGSSFKPFVLAAAFEKGVQPTKVYPAPNQYRIPDCKPTPRFDCTIGNFEGASFGSADLRRATHASINTVYAQLVRDVGCKETGEMAKKLGITSAWYSPRIHTCSGSYALGTLDVAPLEMASAYGTFANRGMRMEPTPIARIKDTTGAVLEDNTKREGVRAVEEVVADNVTDVLKGVITSGTGKRASIGRPAAGKTGTAQENKNSWFVGYTPTLSTAIWVGYRDEPIPMRGIKGCAQMTGGCLPAGTWKSFMTEALEGVPATEFSEAAPIKLITDKLNREARTGIDPGAARKPAGTAAGGPYIVGPPAPTAEVPPAEASTTTTTPATTTTTARPSGSSTTTSTTSTTILPRN